jgi:hypothetical protein
VTHSDYLTIRARWATCLASCREWRYSDSLTVELSIQVLWDSSQVPSDSIPALRQSEAESCCPSEVVLCYRSAAVLALPLAAHSATLDPHVRSRRLQRQHLQLPQPALQPRWQNRESAKVSLTCLLSCS